MQHKKNNVIPRKSSLPSAAGFVCFIFCKKAKKTPQNMLIRIFFLIAQHKTYVKLFIKTKSNIQYVQFTVLEPEKINKNIYYRPLYAFDAKQTNSIPKVSKKVR